MPVAIPTAALTRFERLSFVTRGPARGGLGGEHRSRRPSPSTDFVDYRPYHPGDDFRRVDWNVYGRLGSLQVKVTEGRERLDVMLVVDCSASMDFGKPDKLAFAAQVAAGLGWVGLARADQLTLATLGERGVSSIGPLHGRARLGEVVQFLSAVAGQGRLNLEFDLAQALPVRGTPSLVLVVSDLMTPRGIGAALDRLSGVDVVVLHVVSPDELDPRVGGDIELQDAETGAVLEFGASLHTLAAYRARFAEWLEQQHDDCVARGMRYVRLRTDRELDGVMLDDLRRAGVLR